MKRMIVILGSVIALAMLSLTVGGTAWGGTYGSSSGGQATPPTTEHCGCTTTTTTPPTTTTTAPPDTTTTTTPPTTTTTITATTAPPVPVPAVVNTPPAAPPTVVPVSVQPSATPTSLPFTGVNTTPLVIAGVILVALGLCLLMSAESWRRMRRRLMAAVRHRRPLSLLAALYQRLHSATGPRWMDHALTRISKARISKGHPEPSRRTSTGRAAPRGVFCSNRSAVRVGALPGGSCAPAPTPRGAEPIFTDPVAGDVGKTVRVDRCESEVRALRPRGAGSVSGCRPPMHSIDVGASRRGPPPHPRHYRGVPPEGGRHRGQAPGSALIGSGSFRSGPARASPPGSARASPFPSPVATVRPGALSIF